MEKEEGHHPLFITVKEEEPGKDGIKRTKILFYSEKPIVHSHKTSCTHTQVCDSICTVPYSRETVFFAYEKAVYQYNISTREAKIVIEPIVHLHRWRGNLYSVKAKHGYLCACGDDVLYIKDLSTGHLLCPADGVKPTLYRGMLNGLDLNYYYAKNNSSSSSSNTERERTVRLFVATNNGKLNIFSLPSMTLVARISFPRAVNYVSCSNDNTRFVTVTDDDQVRVHIINQIPEVGNEKKGKYMEGIENNMEGKEMIEKKEEEVDEIEEEEYSLTPEFSSYSSASLSSYEEISESSEEEEEEGDDEGDDDVDDDEEEEENDYYDYDEEEEEEEMCSYQMIELKAKEVSPTAPYSMEFTLTNFATGRGQYPQYCDWSADSRIFVVSSENYTVGWWDAYAQKMLGEIQCETKPYGVRFSTYQSSSLFAFVERDKLHVVNPYHFETQHQTILLKDYYITGLAFSDQSRKLFVGTTQGILEFNGVGVRSLTELCITYIRKHLYYWESPSTTSPTSKRKEEHCTSLSTIPTYLSLPPPSFTSLLPYDLISRIYPDNNIRFL